MKVEFYFLGKNQKVFGPISGEELARMKSAGELSHYTWILKVGEGAWTVLDPPPPIIPQFTPAVQPTTASNPEIAAKTPPPEKAASNPAISAKVSASETAVSNPEISAKTPAPEPMPEKAASNPAISAKTPAPKAKPASKELEEHTVNVDLRAPRVSSSYRDSRIPTASHDAFRAILFDTRNAVTAWVSEAAHHGCEIRADMEGADPLFVEKAAAVLNLHEVATGKTTKIPVKVEQVFRRDQHWVYRVRWTAVPHIFAESEAS